MDQSLVIFIHLSCWILLWISCYPGLMVHLLSLVLIAILPFYIYPPLLLPALVLGITIIWWRGKRTRQRLIKKMYLSSRTHDQRYLQVLRTATIPMILIVVLAIWTNLPQKIALGLSLPAFEAVMTETANSKENCTNKQLGFYHISSCSGETDSSWHFHIPDFYFNFSRNHYGFAYKNSAAYFCYSSSKPPTTFYPIFGDWASFNSDCW